MSDSTRGDSPRGRRRASAAGNSGEKPRAITITDSTLIPQRGEKGVFNAWRISLIGAVVLLALLPVMNTAEVQAFLHNFWHSLFPLQKGEHDIILEAIADGSYVNHYWATLVFVPDGLIVTFEVTVFAIIPATIIGLFAGLGQLSHNKFLNRLSTVYVEVIRGIPLLVQIFYIYFSLGQIVRLSGLFAAVIALAFCYGAYMGEIFRAGLQSIPRGQLEASLALGLTRRQALRFVIVPQTLKVIIPAIGNEFIALLKDSSLVSILALTDLMQRGRQYTSRTLSYFEAFTIIALMYLIMTLLLSRVVGMIEERMGRRAR